MTFLVLIGKYLSYKILKVLKNVVNAVRADLMTVIDCILGSLLSAILKFIILSTVLQPGEGLFLKNK